jgi:hypothetical protein
MTDMDDNLSVERLIETADELANHGHYRAAVMEAMTALEERANDAVFRSLERRRGLPHNLVKWLKDKTKYSFDEKLHPIGEFALGKPISKGEILWSNYKKARDLRNKVSHTAQRITEDNARFVIRTVKEWLYFLEGAQDVKTSDEASDQTMQFLSLYALLVSRFRFPNGTRPMPIPMAVRNAQSRGVLSVAEVQLVRTIVAYRNKVAHGLSVPPDELRQAMRELKKLLARLKGVEIDASPIGGSEQNQ